MSTQFPIPRSLRLESAAMDVAVAINAERNQILMSSSGHDELAVHSLFRNSDISSHPDLRLGAFALFHRSDHRITCLLP
jgi:hypothetical protein